MKKYFYLIAILSLFASCEKDEQQQTPDITTEYGTFVDTRDNREYKSITINGQTWMAENLKYRLPNGCIDGCLTYEEEDDSVKVYNSVKNKININKTTFSSRVKELSPNSAKFGTLEASMWLMNGASDEFCHPTRGSYYYSSYDSFERNYFFPNVVNPFLTGYPSFANDINAFVEVLRKANSEQEVPLIKAGIDAQADYDYVDKYGYLYSYANIEKAVPKGWRLPTDEDWKKLEESLGVTNNQINSLEQWRGDNVTSLLKNGNDAIGFNAEYPGCLVYGQMISGTKYRNRDFKCYYWTSSKLLSDNRELAIIRALQYNLGGIFRGTSPTVQAAYSIRCIKE